MFPTHHNRTFSARVGATHLHEGSFDASPVFRLLISRTVCRGNASGALTSINMGNAVRFRGAGHHHLKCRKKKTMLAVSTWR
jgi:hypothetical protein